MNISREIESIVKAQIREGCQDNGCRLKKHTGQGTNAGCFCASHIASKVIEFVLDNEGSWDDQLADIKNNMLEQKKHGG